MACRVFSKDVYSKQCLSVLVCILFFHLLKKKSQGNVHFGLLRFNSSELSELLLYRRKSCLTEYGPKDRNGIEGKKLCGNRFQLILKKLLY